NQVTTQVNPLSLPDALPIFERFGTKRKPARGNKRKSAQEPAGKTGPLLSCVDPMPRCRPLGHAALPLRLTDAMVHTGPQFLQARAEEHTSELQSRENLVCRL